MIHTFNEGDNISSAPQQPDLLLPNKVDIDEARKLNNSIFNRAPTLKDEQNAILKNLGGDQNYDIGKSNEYFAKVKAIEY
mmetsp:Transcript_8712/g.9899  ORF Transcript_8712/g.9899 Transcript_8712/m.9899 type:complete len:80 (+) Transcript_8712:81-320(+)